MHTLTRGAQIMGVVDVKHASDFKLLIEWMGSTSNDMIADSVLALLLGIDSSPASVKRGYCIRGSVG